MLGWLDFIKDKLIYTSSDLEMFIQNSRFFIKKFNIVQHNLKRISDISIYADYVELDVGLHLGEHLIVAHDISEIFTGMLLEDCVPKIRAMGKSVKWDFKASVDISKFIDYEKDITTGKIENPSINSVQVGKFVKPGKLPLDMWDVNSYSDYRAALTVKADFITTDDCERAIFCKQKVLKTLNSI